MASTPANSTPTSTRSSPTASRGSRGASGWNTATAQAQAQFEWVQREPRPTVIMPLPCPETHRCGVCGRASSRHVASPSRSRSSPIMRRKRPRASSTSGQDGARAGRRRVAVRGRQATPCAPDDHRNHRSTRVADPGRGPPDAHRRGTRTATLRRPPKNPTGRRTPTRTTNRPTTTGGGGCISRTAASTSRAAALIFDDGAGRPT